MVENNRGIMLGKKTQGVEILNSMSTILKSDSFKQHFAPIEKTAQTKEAPFMRPEVDQPGLKGSDQLEKELAALHKATNTKQDGSAKSLEEKRNDGSLEVQAAITAILARSPADRQRPLRETHAAQLDTIKKFLEKNPQLAAIAPSVKTASAVIDQLVKIADYLAENEMFTSEALVDNLIETIISENK